MEFNRKKIFLTILIIAGTGLVAVIFLESVSKKNDCRISSIPPSSSLLLQKFQPKLDITERIKLISDLKSKREGGDKITKEEFRQAAEGLILIVDPSYLGHYNGVAYSNEGYIRNDLPTEAKKFVQRHELEHLLQTGKEKNREFSANVAAAKEYPRGFIETIFFSLQKRAKYYDSSLCYLVLLWRTFKIYFLP